MEPALVEYARDTVRGVQAPEAPALRRPSGLPAGRAGPASVLALQRLVGNRAAAGLLGGGRIICQKSFPRPAGALQSLGPADRTGQRFRGSGNFAGGAVEGEGNEAERGTRESGFPIAQRLGTSPRPDAPIGVCVQRDWWDDASDLASGALNTVGDAASGVVDTASGAASGVVDAVGGAASGIAAGVSNVVAGAGEAVSGAIDAVTGAASGVVDAASQAVSGGGGDKAAGAPK